MRIEYLLTAVVVFILGNIYTEGRWFAWALSKRKYYQMAAVVFGALVIYWAFRGGSSPAEIARRSASCMKYLPLDSSASAIINPILDFTGHLDVRDLTHPILPLHPPQLGGRGVHPEGYPPTGTRVVKRSVSETRKKVVAARQNWKCQQCKQQLSAWFEVDHVVRLDRGGSNDPDNLVAMCRECHGHKTGMENL